MKRFISLALALAVLFAGLFALAHFFGWVSDEELRAWLLARGSAPEGRWITAAAVVGLLGVDLLLPIPSSVVMTAAGFLLGPWWGCLASFVGAMGGGFLGFFAVRWGGQAAFERFVGDQETERVRAWFARYGTTAIVLSRPLPMMTEILSCLAGLTDLSWRRFGLASALGTLPVCAVYAYVGSQGSVDNPWPAVWGAVLLPALGWIVARRIAARNPAAPPPEQPGAAPPDPRAQP